MGAVLVLIPGVEFRKSPRSPEDASRHVCDSGVEEVGRGDAGVYEHRQSVHCAEDSHPEILEVPNDPLVGTRLQEHHLPGFDGGLTCSVDRTVWGGVLTGEHERQQLTRTGDEAGVGACQRGDTGVERWSRGVKGGAEFGAQPLVAPLRQRVEERLPVGEVSTRSAVAHAGRPGQFP